MVQITARATDHATNVVWPCCVPGFVNRNEWVSRGCVVDFEPAADTQPDIILADVSRTVLIGRGVVECSAGSVIAPFQRLNAGAGVCCGNCQTEACGQCGQAQLRQGMSNQFDSGQVRLPCSMSCHFNPNARVQPSHSSLAARIAPKTSAGLGCGLFR